MGQTIWKRQASAGKIRPIKDIVPRQRDTHINHHKIIWRPTHGLNVNACFIAVSLQQRINRNSASGLPEFRFRFNGIPAPVYRNSVAGLTEFRCRFTKIPVPVYRYSGGCIDSGSDEKITGIRPEYWTKFMLKYLVLSSIIVYISYALGFINILPHHKQL